MMTKEWKKRLILFHAYFTLFFIRDPRIQNNIEQNIPIAKHWDCCEERKKEEYKRKRWNVPMRHKNPKQLTFCTFNSWIIYLSVKWQKQRICCACRRYTTFFPPKHHVFSKYLFFFISCGHFAACKNPIKTSVFRFWIWKKINK